MAMMLSSLRVFCARVSSMDSKSMDCVLHAFHILTNFPPAVYALHVLVRNRTPTAMMCAAVSQAIFHAMKENLPQLAQALTPGRMLEASRLFFGFVLDKAKHIKALDEQN